MPGEINLISVFCPYVMLLFAWPDIYWDNCIEYWGLFLSLAFYLGSTALAVTVAKRREFHKYDLKMITGVPSALAGCLFCWVVCFPYFLYNWKLVSLGKAPPRANREISPMIVLTATFSTALWGMWLAVAIPSLIQSPMRANAATAVTCLIVYESAQITFQLKRRGNGAGTVGFCDNFRNLYYGRDSEGNRLELTSRAMADAFAGPATGIPTTADAARTSQPYHGYVFLEDPYVANNRLWEKDYALIAYPVRPRRTGLDFYWINSRGTILRRDCGEGPFRLLTEEESPLHPEGRALWEEL